MRNRIYITSIIDDNEAFATEQAAMESSFTTYKNVLIFVEHLHAIFLNGKRYGSMNEAKNDNSVASVFKLGICADDYASSIKLVQQSIKRGLNANAILISGAWVRKVKNKEIDTYEIYLNLRERAQVFLGYERNWMWNYEGDNQCAVVDGNNIIHGIKSGTQHISLYHSSMPDVILANFIVYVYDSDHNLYKTETYHTIFDNIDNIKEHSFDDIINNSSNINLGGGEIHIRKDNH